MPAHVLDDRSSRSRRDALELVALHVGRHACHSLGRSESTDRRLAPEPLALLDGLELAIGMEPTAEERDDPEDENGGRPALSDEIPNLTRGRLPERLDHALTLRDVSHARV